MTQTSFITFLKLVALFFFQFATTALAHTEISQLDKFYCSLKLYELPRLSLRDHTEAAAEADQRVHVFIIQHRRLPKGSDPNEFSLLKIDRKRWTGASNFQKPELVHKLFHPSHIAAWTRQLELLEETPLFKGFTLKDKARLRRMIQGEIFRYLEKDVQQQLADQRVVEAWIEEQRIFDRDSEIWKEIGFSQTRWVGSGSFAVRERKSAPHDYSGLRFHDSRLEALQAALAIIEARPDKERPEVAKIRIEVLKNIFIESNSEQKKEVALARVTHFIFTNHRAPRTFSSLENCEFNQMGLVYHSIIGPQEGALYKDVPEFYSAITQVVHADSRYQSLSSEEKILIDKILNDQILKSRRWAFRKLPKLEQRQQVDAAVAHWIHLNLRLPTYSEIEAISYPTIDITKWLGIQEYLYRFGPAWKRALHRHPSYAWNSVARLLEAKPIDEKFTFEKKKQLLNQLKRKALLSRMNKREKRDWVDLRVAKYILKYGRIPQRYGDPEFDSRSFAELFGVSYQKWAGTNDYSNIAVSSKNGDRALHPDPAEAFLSVRKILESISLPEGVTEIRRAELIDLINTRIRITASRFGVEWVP